MTKEAWGSIRLSILLLLLACASCGVQPELSPIPQHGIILAFGDSLTYGVGVTAGASYPARLQILANRKVIRSGVPGEVSGAGLERLESVLREVHPDLVILCHGGNDVLRRVRKSTTESNLRQMVALVRSKGAQAVLIAVPAPGLFPEAQDYYESLRDDLQVPVEFDILSDLEADRTMKSDRVHFNQKGYDKMALAVYDLLTSSGAL